MSKAIEADWKEIQIAVCAGMDFKEASEKYGVNYHTIKKRAIREKWPTKFAVKAKIEQLKAQKAKDLVPYVPLSPVETEKPMSLNVSQDDLVTKMAENWLEKGEGHRALAFELATKALKQVKDELPRLEYWADIERADKMARRAAGLESDDAPKVNVNLQLVNQRLTQIMSDMPLDAVE